MQETASVTTGATRRAGGLDSRRLQTPVVVTAALLLLGGALLVARAHGPRQALLLLIGAGCGLVLHHAAFGFTSAWRALVTSGDGRGLRAQMVVLAVTTLLFAPILASGRGAGTPAGGAVAPASLSVLAGAFVFAVGMQLGGGCGSGTLFHLGAGVTRLAFTLAGFVAGSVIATFHAPFWSRLPSLGEVALGDTLGWPAAVAVQLTAFGSIALVSWWIERRRLGPRRPSAPALRGLARLARGPWPLLAGALALAALNAATLLVAGHPWTITWAFALWGGKLLEAIGFDLSTVPFWSGEFQQEALAAPLLADVTTVMDLGIVLGAFLGSGLAGRFAPRRVRVNVAAAGLLGGLLLGYGARIAFGCNIGAFVSGIASTSLHGWLWVAAALAGTPVGVWLRARFGIGRAPGE